MEVLALKRANYCHPEFGLLSASFSSSSLSWVFVQILRHHYHRLRLHLQETTQLVQRAGPR